MSTNTSISLFDEFRQRRRDLFRTLGPGLLLALIAFLIAFYFVEPPPPDTIVIASGRSGGGYYETAKAYRDLLQAEHVTLEIRETAGSVENYELLMHDPTVSLAILQGGSISETLEGNQQLESLATLYFEPLWVFHRSNLDIRDLGDLEGHRIAVGESGSGSHTLTLQLLSANGVFADEDGTQFVEVNAADAADALRDGELDAAMFVMAATTPLVLDLLARDDLTLLDFRRQKTYTRRFPFLKDVVLEEGVLSLERNLPRQAVRLIAPAACLVASADLHEAFVPLLMDAAVKQHQHGGLFVTDGELPSLEYLTFPVNSAARNFLLHGPTFSQRHLTFWIASLIDRTKIMIIPLLALLIPLIRAAPPVYRWRIRSRIYRWYGVLRRIDQRYRGGEDVDVDALVATLDTMSRELDAVDVPLSYMEEFYNLRVHISLVKLELTQLSRERSQGASDQTSQPQTQDD